jgi:SPP1 family predicted phage head-tail adaptor
MVSEVEARVTIRYRPEVTAKMKIVKGTDEYLIESIINVMERNRELQLMCKRFVE